MPELVPKIRAGNSVQIRAKPTILNQIIISALLVPKTITFMSRRFS